MSKHVTRFFFPWAFLFVLLSIALSFASPFLVPFMLDANWKSTHLWELVCFILSLVLLFLLLALLAKKMRHYPQQNRLIRFGNAYWLFSFPPLMASVFVLYYVLPSFALVSFNSQEAFSYCAGYVLLGLYGSFMPRALLYVKGSLPNAIPSRDAGAIKAKDPFINRFAPYFLAFYSLASIVTWMQYPNEQIYKLLNEGTPALIYRGILGAMFVGYMLLICIINKKLPPWRHTVLFFLVGVYLGILVFTQPRTYVYDADQAAFAVAGVFTAKFYLGWAYSIFMAYCLLFVMPIAKTKRKIPYLPFLIIWILAGLVFMAYSLKTESEVYKQALTFSTENKWITDIHSFFGQKNAFGMAIFGSFAACLLLAQQSKWFVKIPLWLLAVVFFAETGLIHCSTAAVAEVVTAVAFYLVLCFQNLRKHPAVAWSFLSFAFLCCAAMAGILNIPALYESNKYFAKVRDVILYPDYTGRVAIWETFFEKLNDRSVLFGWGSMGRLLNGYFMQHQFLDYSLHNAYIDVYSAGGYVLLLFYFWVLLQTLSSILKIRKLKPSLFAGSLALFVGCLIYGLTEANHFVFSSSSMTFVASFCVAAIPSTVARIEEKKA